MGPAYTREAIIVTSGGRLPGPEATRDEVTRLCRFGQPPGQRQSEIASVPGEDEPRARELVEKVTYLVPADVRPARGAQGIMHFIHGRSVLAGEVDGRLSLAERIVGLVGLQTSVLHEEAAGRSTIAERPVARRVSASPCLDGPTERHHVGVRIPIVRVRVLERVGEVVE